MWLGPPPSPTFEKRKGVSTGNEAREQVSEERQDSLNLVYCVNLAWGGEKRELKTI